MSVNVPTHFVKQFASNIELLLGQRGSRLRGAVMVGSHKGDAASPVDQYGLVEMQPVTTRFSPLVRVDAATDRRWVYPSDFELPQMLDSFDEHRLLADPKSKYVENAVDAAGRQIDRLILAAALGTAKTGVAGATSTVLPTAQKIVVGFGASGDIGLTVAKLKEAKRLLMKANVNLDVDPLFCPLGADQHDNLLAEVQVISADFNGGEAVMKNGKLQSFLGINFIHTELAVANLTSGDATIPVWAKSGMHLGVWGEIITDVSQRKDLTSLPWQAYVKMTMGATRLEEAKVVQIACNV